MTTETAVADSADHVLRGQRFGLAAEHRLGLGGRSCLWHPHASSSRICASDSEDCLNPWLCDRLCKSRDSCAACRSAC